MTDRISESIAMELDNAFDNMIRSVGFETISLSGSDTTTVFDWYFDGKKPFTATKSRKDIPDAFICASAVRVLLKEPDGILVSNDQNICDFCTNQGISVERSVDNLLQNAAVAGLTNDAEFAVWWHNHHNEVGEMLAEHSDKLHEPITVETSQLLWNEGIRNSKIPSYRNEASIVSAHSYKNIEIDWEGHESLGEGILSAKAAFTCDLDLEFIVHAPSNFNLFPEWVQIHYGDTQPEHFFDASGTIQADLIIKFSIECGPKIKSLCFEKDLLCININHLQLMAVHEIEN